MNILFMCVANSARSQMAEGLAKNLLGKDVWIESAGSEPKTVNPYAIQVMKEIDIDISKQYPKTYDQISPKFVVGLDFIITLCAEEVCPTMVAQKAKKLHWGFPDPATSKSSPEEQLTTFRSVRDGIKTKIEEFARENGLVYSSDLTG